MAQAASLTTRDEQWAIHAIVHAHHHDPFSYLGMHQTADGLAVRVFLPQAHAVTLIDAAGKPVAEFERIDPEGLFVAHLKGTSRSPTASASHDARRSKTPTASRRCSARWTSTSSPRAIISSSTAASARTR